jgi:hypothetical protein
MGLRPPPFWETIPFPRTIYDLTHKECELELVPN